MNLNDLTKEELIFGINFICGRFYPFNKEYYIKTILHEIEYYREKKNLDKADKLNKLATQKRKEYLELIKPYCENGLKDMTNDVINKAKKLLKEADDADKKWNKIMSVYK